MSRKKRQIEAIKKSRGAGRPDERAGAKKAPKGESAGGANTRKASGVSNTRKASGGANTRKASGVSNTRKASGVSNTRKASGGANTRKASGVSRPRKVAAVASQPRKATSPLHKGRTKPPWEPVSWLGPPALEQLWMLRILLALEGSLSLPNLAGEQDLLRKLGLSELFEDVATIRRATFRRRVLARMGELEQIVGCSWRPARRGQPGTKGPGAVALGGREEYPVDTDREGTIFGSANRMARLLGLDQVERDILAIGALLQCEHDLRELLLSSVNRSPTQFKRALARALGREPAEIGHALRPDGALSESRLVRLHIGADRWDHSNFMMSEDLASLFREEHESDEALLALLVEPAPPARLGPADYEHLGPALELLLGYLTGVSKNGLEVRCQRPTKGANVFLHGAPGVGKTELARCLAATLGAQLYSVPVRDSEGNSMGPRRRMEAFLICQRLLAPRSPAPILLFDEVEDVVGASMFSFFDSDALKWTSRNSEGWLHRVVEENPVPTIWIANSRDRMRPALLRRFDLVIEVPAPPRRVREKILRKASSGLRLGKGAVASLSEEEDLTPADIQAVTRVTRLMGTRPGRAAEERVRQLVGIRSAAKLQIRPRRPLSREGAGGSKGRAREGGSHLRGSLPTALPRLDYDLAFVNASADLERLAEGLAATGQGRLCFDGPPGTGKTATARHIARQLELPVVARRASELISRYIGDSEKAIAEAFRAASQEGAVLLFDEIDSFLRDRGRAERSWEVTQVNELLVQLEAFEGIFIGCTNLVDSLDLASLRRFDLKVRFGYLGKEQRRLMFERTLDALAAASRPARKGRGAFARGPVVRGLAPSVSSGADPPGGSILEDPSLCSRLDALDMLTPGDFAVVLRQAFLVGAASGGRGGGGRGAGAAQPFRGLLEALEREHDLKPGRSRPVGFRSQA
ncbi:MAG: ATP-binding protein [Polyangia bacterium]|jgi:ATP-dependent 26S proteasome regulatory subunit|nr:ATP-binding protein [Polyangia bacterium]